MKKKTGYAKMRDKIIPASVWVVVVVVVVVAGVDGGMKLIE